MKRNKTTTPTALRLRPRGAPLPPPKTILTKRDKARTRMALKLRLHKEEY